MLQILSPKAINESPYRRRLAEAGIKGGWNYALDHAWLFEQIDTYIKERNLLFPVILDVGCGNSMFHPFIEKELRLGIIGIDRVEGMCPHTPGRTNIIDICADFRELSHRLAEIADIVYWLSSIEHNTIPEMKRCLEASLRVLKPGGLFLATFAFSSQTHYYEPSDQTNLSACDAVTVFEIPWKSEPDFETTVEEFRLDLMDLDSRHSKRYGTNDYAFVVAGASILKESSAV